MRVIKLFGFVHHKRPDLLLTPTSCAEIRLHSFRCSVTRSCSQKVLASFIGKRERERERSSGGEETEQQRCSFTGNRWLNRSSSPFPGHG